MNHKQLFRPFRLRLLGHSLLRSILTGLITGAGVTFILSLVWHLMVKAPPSWLLPAAFAGAFALGFIPTLCKTYPTEKRVAQKLDQTGLQERAGTMLAFQDSKGLMAQLQRKDAIKHIRRTSPGKLKVPFPKRLALICSLCVVLCGTILLLPQDFFVSAADMEEYLAQQELRDQIEQLRQQIRQSNLSNKLKEQMLEILDQLEKDLLKAQDEMEQAALIQQAQQQMQDVTLTTISRFIIGEALQEYTMTRPLGIQLAGNEPHHIETHMDQLEAQAQSSSRQITRLCGNISAAIESTGFGTSDELYAALYKMVNSLENLNTSAFIGEAGTAEEQAPVGTDITTIFNIAEEEILYALDFQLHDEAEVREVFRSMTRLSGATPEEKMVGMENEFAKEEDAEGAGANGSAGTTTGSTAGGIVTSYGPSNSGNTTMVEPIYDPVSGDVTYGEVFAVYYAQYLDALDKEEISDELRIYIEKYFSALS